MAIHFLFVWVKKTAVEQFLETVKALLSCVLIMIQKHYHLMIS